MARRKPAAESHIIGTARQGLLTGADDIAAPRNRELPPASRPAAARPSQTAHGWATAVTNGVVGRAAISGSSSRIGLKLVTSPAWPLGSAAVRVTAAIGRHSPGRGRPVTARPKPPDRRPPYPVMTRPPSRPLEQSVLVQ